MGAWLGYVLLILLSVSRKISATSCISRKC